MSEITEESAKKFLESKGYYVEGLWHLKDVQDNYKCTKEQAESILHVALTCESTMDAVWFAIRDISENLMELKSTEETFDVKFKQTGEHIANKSYTNTEEDLDIYDTIEYLMDFYFIKDCHSYDDIKDSLDELEEGNRLVIRDKEIELIVTKNK